MPEINNIVAFGFTEIDKRLDEIIKKYESIGYHSDLPS